MVNLTQLIKDMLFVSSDKNNPTQVTPAQFNGLTKTEIDVLMKKKIAKTALPFTRYGDQSFLPINATGSFEGSSLNGAAILANLEPDGSILMLRCGIDGRKQGVYYAQLELTNGIYTRIKPLGTEYRPSFIPDGYWVEFIMQTAPGQVAGRIRNAAADESLWFIARTNGTLDATKHEGFIISGQIWSEGSIYLMDDNTIWSFSNMVIANDSPVFMMMATGKAVAGQTSTITKIDNWTCNGVTKQYPDTNIKLSNLGSNIDPALDPYVLISGPNVAGMGPSMGRSYLQVDYLGGTQFSVMWSHETWVGLSNGASDRKWFVRSMVVDVAAKTATLSDDTRGVTTMVNNGTSISLQGTAVRDPVKHRNGGVGNYISCYSRLSDGRVIGSFFQNSTMRVYMSNNPLTVAQYGSPNRDLSPSTSNEYFPLYGSPIGAQVYAITPHTWDRAIVRSLWGDGNGLTWQSVSIPLPATLADYRLPNGRLTKSVALSSDRRIINPGRPLCMHLTEFAIGKCNRSHCLSRVRLVGCSNLDENYNGVDNMTVTAAHFDVAENAVRADLVAKGYTVQRLVSAIYIPQITGSTPPFAVVHATYAGATCAVYHVALNYGGQKTGAFPVPSVINLMGSLDWFNNANTELVYRESDHMGICTYEGNGAVAVYGVAPIWEGHVGNGCMMGVRAFHTPAGILNMDLRNPTYVYATDGENHIIMHPAFAQWFNGEVTARGSSAVGSNSGYCAVGVCLATNNGAGVDGSQEVVVATQAVVNGWVVYVTDQIPCSVPGFEGVLPTLTLDLTTISNPPSNQTYYFYVEINAGVFSYKVSLTPLVASLSRLYIGNVTTNEVGIDKINIKKVVGIGGYSLSAVNVGSAIPISTGLPNETGNFAW